MTHERQLGRIESEYPTYGAGRGRLDFDKPYLAEALYTGRSKETKSGITNAREIAENVNELLNLQEGQVFADFGCGPGLISYYLAPKLGEKGWIYCVDASPSMLNVAERVMLGKNATLVHGDIHVVDKVLPEKLDAALLSGNVHLLTDRELAFRSIWKTLRPGGKLVVVCHAYSTAEKGGTNAFANLIDNLRESRADLKVDGLRLPMLSSKEVDEIARVMKKAGFKISFFEKDTWSSDTDDVFGHPPTLTIEKRLEAIKKAIDGGGQIDIKRLASRTMSEISIGNAAQLYILCAKSDPISAQESSNIHLIGKKV